MASSFHKMPERTGKPARSHSLGPTCASFMLIFTSPARCSLAPTWVLCAVITAVKPGVRSVLAYPEVSRCTRSRGEPPITLNSLQPRMTSTGIPEAVEVSAPINCWNCSSPRCFSMPSIAWPRAGEGHPKRIVPVSRRKRRRAAICLKRILDILSMLQLTPVTQDLPISRKSQWRCFSRGKEGQLAHFVGLSNHVSYIIIDHAGLKCYYHVGVTMLTVD